MDDFVIPRLEQLDTQPEVERILLGLKEHPGVQTLLWIGPPGSGKKTHALALARSYFCLQGKDCGGCAACRQVLAKTHPDLFWVHREHFWSDEKEDRKKQGIIVNTAKLLSQKISRAPLAAACKIAVIPNAHEMNEDAQNVLLKTLEEPPAATYIILMTDKENALLPTILSRCRPIRFHPIPQGKIEEVLVKTRGWNPGEARKAAGEAEGNLTQALREADPDWVSFREKVKSDLDRVMAGPDGDWLALTTEYEQWEPDFLGDAILTATQRRAVVLKTALQIYLGFWRKRLNGEMDVPSCFSTLPPERVLACLQKHQDMVETNLSTRMILDHLFLELREGFQKGGLSDKSFIDLAVQI